MGFFQYLNGKYGPQACCYAKEIMNINRKLAYVKSHLTYLIKCRTKEVFPRHIVIKCNSIKYFSNEFDDMTPRPDVMYMKRMLRSEINGTSDKMKRIEFQKNQTCEKLRGIINATEYYTYLKMLQNNFAHMMVRANGRHIKMFAGVLNSQRCFNVRNDN